MISQRPEVTVPEYTQCPGRIAFVLVIFVRVVYIGRWYGLANGAGVAERYTRLSQKLTKPPIRTDG